MKTFMGDIRKTLSERYGYESQHVGEVGARTPTTVKIWKELPIVIFLNSNKNTPMFLVIC